MENMAVLEKLAVEINNLNKNFDEVHALDNINIAVKEGEFVSVIGVSGCGKSTLIRIIGGLESATSGEVIVNGEAVSGPSKRIGFVFQDHRLLPWLTVSENVKLALDRNEKEADAIVDKHLRLVGLEAFKASYPGQLSGGMAQRVAIARALANKPDILLLDEPFGALDAITRINMQQELRKIWKSERITMILITHDIEEAIFLGQRVVVMSSRPGRIKKSVEISEECHYQRTGTEFATAKDIIYKEFFRDEEIPFSYNI